MVVKDPSAADEGQPQQAEVPALPTVNCLLEFHDSRLEASYQQHVIAGTRPQTLAPLVAFHLVLSICTVLRAVAGLQPWGVLPVATLVLVAGHLLLLRLTSRRPQQWLYKWRLVGVTILRLIHLLGVVTCQLASEAASALMHKTGGGGIDSSSTSSSSGWQVSTSHGWSTHPVPSNTSAAAAAAAAAARGSWQECPGPSCPSYSSRPLHTTAAVIAAVMNPQLLAATAATPVVGSAVLSLLLPLPLRLHVPLQGLLCVLVAWQPGTYPGALLSSYSAHTVGAVPPADYQQAAGGGTDLQQGSMSGVMDAAAGPGRLPPIDPGIWQVLQCASCSLLPLLPTKEAAAQPSGTQECSLSDGFSSNSSSVCAGAEGWCQLAAVQAVGWAFICTTCVRYMVECSSRAAFLRALQLRDVQHQQDSWQQAVADDSSTAKANLEADSAPISTTSSSSKGARGGGHSTGHLQCASTTGAGASSTHQPVQGTEPDEDAACWGMGREQQQPCVVDSSTAGDSEVTPANEVSWSDVDKAAQGISAPDGLSLQPAQLNKQQLSLLLVPLKCTAVGMCTLVLCLLPLLLQGFRELCQLGDQPLAVSPGVWLHISISAAAQVLLAAGVGATASLLTRAVLLTPLLLRGQLW